LNACCTRANDLENEGVLITCGGTEIVTIQNDHTDFIFVFNIFRKSVSVRHQQQSHCGGEKSHMWCDALGPHLMKKNVGSAHFCFVYLLPAEPVHS